MLEGDYDTDQERLEASEEVDRNEYTNGMDDGYHSRLPMYKDESYLLGYCAGVRTRPTHADGTILHYSPGQHFAYGRVDNPDPCTCEEF